MTFATAILDEENETLRTIPLCCRKIVHGETSEETINALMEIFTEGKNYLVRWAQNHMKKYSNELHDIPLPENFDLVNYSSSAFTTDTCEKATKSRRVIEAKVNDREMETSGKCMFYLSTITICNPLQIF